MCGTGAPWLVGRSKSNEGEGGRVLAKGPLESNQIYKVGTAK